MLPLASIVLLQPAAPEAASIEALIRSVEALQGAVFLRNGTDHSPQEAGLHLRLKLRNAGRRAKSAPDFIRLCGTGSSLSGEPYRIRFKDGRTQPAAEFLWSELKRQESAAK